MPPDLTPLQYELVTILLPQPGATLRWYSHQHPNKDLSGRGELQGRFSRAHGLLPLAINGRPQLADVAAQDAHLRSASNKAVTPCPT